MEATTPMKAIRLKCLDCMCGQVNEVRLCPTQDCPLWRYRSGHNPARQGKRTGVMPAQLRISRQSGADTEEEA